MQRCVKNTEKLLENRESRRRETVDAERERERGGGEEGEEEEGAVEN